MDRYKLLNRANWDERAPAHSASSDYCVEQLVADPGYLSEVVQFDRTRLGELRGQRGLHLQCHIGTDTVSLARLGAQMVGLDFSPASLVEARKLSARCGTAVDFVESDVYDAPSVLGRHRFDLVYTGIGAICWLPSIHRWAHVVSELLVPGGRLFIREGHPMLWALADPDERKLLLVEYSYFERPEPTVFTYPGTYVSTDSSFQHNTTHEWNHGFGEIITALLDTGLELTGLVEHDSVPWNALPGMMSPVGGGEWRLDDRPHRLPASYTLQARKRP